MTASLLDELPGVGPARKRALIAHFGSPDARPRGERRAPPGGPGLPAKVGRELYAHLHRTDEEPSSARRAAARASGRVRRRLRARWPTCRAARSRI